MTETGSRVSGGRTSRVAWADRLRIVSAFAVVLLHVSASRLSHGHPFRDGNWTLMLCRGVPSFAVPCFFMLSGVFFLDPERNVSARKAWRAGGRLLLAYFFWTAFYLLAFPPHWFHFADLFRGAVHLWFLPVLAACHFATPALCVLAAEGKAVRTLLLFAALFALVFPTMRQFWPTAARTLPAPADIAVLSYPVVYYLLGDLLNRFPPRGKRLGAALGLGAAGFAAAFALACFDRIRNGTVGSGWGPGQICVALYAAAVFLRFRCRGRAEGAVSSPALARFAGLTMGVYLLHPAFARLLRPFFMELSALRFRSVGSCLVQTVAVFLLSALATAAVMSVPGLRDVAAVGGGTGRFGRRRRPADAAAGPDDRR